MVFRTDGRWRRCAGGVVGPPLLLLPRGLPVGVDPRSLPEQLALLFARSLAHSEPRGQGRAPRRSSMLPAAQLDTANWLGPPMVGQTRAGTKVRGAWPAANRWALKAGRVERQEMRRIAQRVELHSNHFLIRGSCTPCNDNCITNLIRWWLPRSQRAPMGAGLPPRRAATRQAQPRWHPTHQSQLRERWASLPSSRTSHLNSPASRNVASCCAVGWGRRFSAVHSPIASIGVCSIFES
jgi:hypothetical protein